MYVASFDFCNTWLALLPWNVNNYAFLDALASLAFKLSQNNTHIFSQHSLHCSTTSLKYVCDLWLFQYLSVYDLNPKNFAFLFQLKFKNCAAYYALFDCAFLLVGWGLVTAISQPALMALLCETGLGYWKCICSNCNFQNYQMYLCTSYISQPLSWLNYMQLGSDIEHVFVQLVKMYLFKLWKVFVQMWNIFVQIVKKCISLMCKRFLSKVSNVHVQII